MKPLKIVFDVQHGGKPHNPLDRGAVYGHLVEADLCLQYATSAYKALTKMGHHVFLMTSGYYGHRAVDANRINADLYLACHLNSFDPPPESNYALIEGTELAGTLTRRFADHLAGIFFHGLPVSASEVRYIKKGERGWSCINRVKAPALILEPGFIQHLDNVLVTKTMWEISQTIVKAIHTFDWEGK